MAIIKLDNVSISGQQIISEDNIVKIFPAKDASGRNYHPDFIKYMKNNSGTLSERTLRWAYVNLIIGDDIFEDALIAVINMVK